MLYCSVLYTFYVFKICPYAIKTKNLCKASDESGLSMMWRIRPRDGEASVVVHRSEIGRPWHVIGAQLSMLCAAQVCNRHGTDVPQVACLPILLLLVASSRSRIHTVIVCRYKAFGP
jgi:hypothetical protein